MKSRNHAFRFALLHGTGTVALATLIAAGAHAGETKITPEITPPPIATGAVDAHAVINGSQVNAGPASASIVDAGATSAATGADSAVSATVDSNAMKADATGNDFSNTIDLSVIPTAEAIGAGDGAAALGFSINVGAISSLVTDDEIAALHADFPLGTLGVTDNTISATANGNSGSTLLHGALLPEYASDAAGSSALTANDASLTDWLDATGSLLASTVQIQSGAISNTATATDNDIRLSILNAADDASVVAAPVLEDNTIAATVAGNSSNSTIDVQAGGASTLTGTAAVTNGQINSSPEAASSIAAHNDDSAIIATIAADGDSTSDDAELQGSLSVAGNAITASASGNRSLGDADNPVGNSILLADGASFAGSANTASPGTDTAYDAGAMLGAVNADLIIHNSQGNAGAANLDRLAVTGSEDDGEIAAVVDDINGGSVAVSNNRITGTASGNAASSALSGGDNMASFAGSAALANQQVNFYTNVLAEGTGNVDARVSDDDEVTESTVSVDGNKVGAAAYGSSASQSLALDAAVQALPLAGVALTGGTGGTFSDGNVHSDGSLTVTSLQANYNTDVDSREVHEIYAAAGGDDVVDSTIAVKGNTAEAVSVGASVANSLALSGTTVGNGAGIVSIQLNDDDDGDDLDETDVSASSTGYTHLDTAAGADSSSLELSGNLQRAIAYGGSAANTLDVSAETITVDGGVDGTASTVGYNEGANDGMALTFTEQPNITAADGVLNVQSLNGDIAATALAADWSGVASSFAVNVDGDVTGGSVVNGGHLEGGVAVGGNALVAAAYGADAANAASLHAGTLGTSDNDFASVMNLTNVQETTDGSSVTAQAAGEAAVYTNVSDDLQDSSVSTSFNAVQALAYANRAANSVAAGGTNIDTEADYFPIRGEVVAGDEGSSTDASFSLNNAQVAGGDIAATLLDNLDPEGAGTSAAVRTVIGDDVTDSSIASNGNTLSSGATGNRADNLLDLAGNGLATTSAIANFQVVSEEAEITSHIGIAGGLQNVIVDPGTPDIDPVPFNITITGTGLGHESGAFTSGTLYVDVTGFTPAQLEALEDAGWSESGEDTYSRSAIGYVATAGEYGDLDEGGSMVRTEDTALIPGIPATYADVYVPGSGGVTIAIGGDLDPSTVSVDGNTTSGSVTGNSASNALTVSGTGVADGSDHLLSYGIVDGADTRADGDHMLTNLQVVDEDDTELTSEVYGTFAIDMNAGADIAASTLTVDGNGQSSRAVANTADNSVELDANNTAAGTALVSNQFGGADVLATSGLDIYTPVASSGSRVSMSDNTNLALAVMNNATNTLTVDANSANPVTNTIDAIADVDSDAVAYGDHVLVNRQVAEDTVEANAATMIHNQDLADADTSGILNGSVTVSGNTTTAEASANRAVNVANVSAGSSLGAAAGVTNSQVSDTEVTSSATTSANIAVAGDSDELTAALNAGSVTVGGNTTAALARGNAATNALNYAAGANYGTGTGDPANSSLAASDTDFRVNAQAAVLNAQANTGPVSASSVDAVYGVALNGVGGFPVTTNGTVGVIGNSVSAAAYGNAAVNSLTLASLNTGQPTAAVGNSQFNSGPVTASVTTVTYGIGTGLGGVSGSALSVSGNQVTATAVGNSATTTIAAR
jgi:hypothetical protein